MGKGRVDKSATKISRKVKKTKARSTPFAVHALVPSSSAEPSTDITTMINASPTMTESPIDDVVNASESLSQKITKFVVFPHFPVEIRNMIWQLSMLEGRIVQLERNDISFIAGTYFSKTAPPAQLHVCHESREEALKVYELAFKSPSSPALIYFNFAIDSIYFGEGIDFPPSEIDPYGKPLPIEDFQKVRYIVATIAALDFHHYINFSNFVNFTALLKVTAIARLVKQPAMRKCSLRLTEEGPCPAWMDFGPSDFDGKMVMGSLEVGTGMAED